MSTTCSATGTGRLQVFASAPTTPADDLRRTFDALPPMLQLPEVAPWVRLSRSAIYRGAKAGTLPFDTIQINGRMLVRREDLRRVLGLDQGD